jgi:hypothetical protein
MKWRLLRAVNIKRRKGGCYGLFQSTAPYESRNAIGNEKPVRIRSFPAEMWREISIPVTQYEAQN